MDSSSASEAAASVPRQAYGGKYCCVVECHNNTYRDVPRGIKFHRFPKDPVRKDLWIRAIKRRVPNDPMKLWEPTERSRICSVHFLGGQKSDDSSSPSYVPTVFPTHVAKGGGIATNSARSRRKQARDSRKSVERTSPSNVSTSQATSIHLAANTPQPGSSSATTLAPEPDLPSTLSLSSIAYNDQSISASSPQIEEMEIGLDWADDSIMELGTSQKTSQVPRIVPTRMIVLPNWTQTEKKLFADCGPDYFLDGFVDKVSQTEKSTQTTFVLQPIKPNKRKSLLNKSMKDKSVSTSDDKKVQLLPFSTFSTDQIKAFCGVDRRIIKFLVMNTEGLYDSRTLSKESKIVLMLARFKLFVSFPVLASFFNISTSSAAMFFREALNSVYTVSKDNLVWFDKRTIKARMPPSFKALYPNTRCIIDCSEIVMERPPKLRQRVLSFSNYKGRYTVKFLLATSPSGEIMFVSPCYGGRVTDAEITVNSGFLELLENGDEVMADKGFPSIEQKLNEVGSVLVMPPFKIGTKQFSSSQAVDAYKIASVRVHVERAIERIKRFEILNYAPIKMMKYMDKILVICCFLSNLQPDLIRK